jgi:alkyl hydroperoxide reductase subunit AhpF
VVPLLDLTAPGTGILREEKERIGPMALLDEEVQAQLKDEFTKLVNPVRLVVFFQALADPESEQVKRLVEELGALDSRLAVEPVNLVLDKERAESLGVTRTPAIAILGADKDYGVRFYGSPGGYEFGTLVDAILDVSSGESGLSPETRDALAALERPVHLQVFSTPT